MGFWAGVVGELNRIEDRNDRRDEFNRKIREDRLNTIIAARARYGAGTTSTSASQGGVQTATGSTVEDSAVLNANVGYLKSVGLDDDMIASWVAIGPTAVSDLRDRVETYVVDNQENPWMRTPEEITRRASALQPHVIAGETIDENSPLDSFGMDLTEEEANYVRAVSPPPRPARVVISDNYVPQVSALGTEDISKVFDNATQDIMNTLETELQQQKFLMAPDYTDPNTNEPLRDDQRLAITNRVNQLETAISRIDNNEGFVPIDIIQQYGAATIAPYLRANPGLAKNAELGQLPGTWGNLVTEMYSAPVLNTEEEVKNYQGRFFYFRDETTLRAKR